MLVDNSAFGSALASGLDSAIRANDPDSSDHQHDFSIGSSLDSLGIATVDFLKTHDGVAKLNNPSKLPEICFAKKKQRSNIVGETAGNGWFDMKAPVITPEIRDDLRILRNRSYVFLHFGFNWHSERFRIYC
jgi:hypothetical protein